MSQSSGEASNNFTVQPHKKTSPWLTALIIGTVVVLFIALLLPTTRSSRSAARRAQCANNLKQIALALRQYEETYHSLPPAFTVDETGNRLHSWRTLILPFLGAKGVYEKIDLSKAWDDPANAEAYNTSISEYRCLGTNCPQYHTTYLASVSPHGCFQPPDGRPPTSIAPSLTLMVIEVPDDRSIHWMSPVDADEARVMEWGPDSKLAHPGGVNAAFCDGRVVFLQSSLSPAARRALISGAEDYESAR